MDNHRCWAEVDLGALKKNAETARTVGAAPIMAIVKADGYGHGVVPVAMALESRAAFVGVASVREALDLKPHLQPEARLFILGPALAEERTAIAENGFVPSLSSLDEAKDFDAIASRLGKKLSVHVIVDTGMGRIGFTGSTLENFLTDHRSFKNLDFEGLATHFPSADEDPAYTLDQIERFKALLESCAAAGLAPRCVHIANSAGLLGFHEHLPRGDFTLLNRPGLMLYGISPQPEFQDKLEPVLELKTRVALLRDLPRGHSVSYGRTFLTSRETTRVATLGIGYGDGYPRHLSGNGAEVLIRGRRCPLLGRVTMDQIMVDATGLGSPAQVGDEAVLIGRQGDETILATEIARKAGTIPWEILTAITARVPRVYLKKNPDNLVNPV